MMTQNVAQGSAAAPTKEACCVNTREKDKTGRQTYTAAK